MGIGDIGAALEARDVLAQQETKAKAIEAANNELQTTGFDLSVCAEGIKKEPEGGRDFSAFKKATACAIYETVADHAGQIYKVDYDKKRDAFVVVLDESDAPKNPASFDAINDSNVLAAYKMADLLNRSLRISGEHYSHRVVNVDPVLREGAVDAQLLSLRFLTADNKSQAVKATGLQGPSFD